MDSSSCEGCSPWGMDTKSTVRNDVLARNGAGAKCNSFWRTLRTGASAMLSEPVPDGDGDGAFRLTMARDVCTVKHNERRQVKFRCINCMVLFAVNRLFQGP